MNITQKTIYIFTLLSCWPTSYASYMFDMTQDRPINGLMPVPDQIYLPTGNLHSLMRCHSTSRKKVRTRFGLRALKEQYAEEDRCKASRRCAPWKRKS